MIFYGSTRGRWAELAAHLVNAEDNEHVAVHEVRGFVSEDLAEALEEAYAISKGTRCDKYLFSLSLNPPHTADVTIEAFESAIADVEKKLGFVDQPRIIVFHEKEGRRHCHAVWSRIDGEKMTAIPVPHFKLKLMDVSRQLFLQHGWEMPKGLQKGKDRSPFNLSREEYRQAKRVLEDPPALKAVFQQSWERTDSKNTFTRMLEENGLYLAQGDRRGYVAVDLKGKVYSLTRWIGVSTRDLKARLGPPEDLASTEKAKAFIASRMTENMKRYLAEAEEQAKARKAPLLQEIRAMTAHHRADRAELIEMQEKRRDEESRTRSERFSVGVSGLWERVTGEYERKALKNEQEAKACFDRDRNELQALIRKQLLERQELQKTVKFFRQEGQADVARLKREIARYIGSATEPPPEKLETQAKKAEVPPLAAQIAAIEAQLSVLSGDILSLKAALESNLISEATRAKIRRWIEKTAAALHLKGPDYILRQQKAEAKARAIARKQAEYNDLVRRLTELQQRQEQERRQWELNREFYDRINNMRNSLNGVPLYLITMTVPEHLRLDERAYIKDLRQQSNTELLNTVFKTADAGRGVYTPPPQRPASAVPDLRQSILQVKELLNRANMSPADMAGDSYVPAKGAKASAKFNSLKN